ncbi:MAG: prepilin-type N-terminal cleavage/methylation domain-containing protein [bacterium]|nr:prepilin-type N-terminal cleavage/methylation domain-containing protein [bacterium]
MKRQGFTLIELLVVIAIIAILASILFPVFSTARGKAQQATCQSNLKQWGQIMAMYTQDWDDYLPAAVPCPTGQSYGGYWNNFNCPLRQTYFAKVSRNDWGSGVSINGCPSQSDTPYTGWPGYTYRHWSYVMCETTFGNTVGESINLCDIPKPASLIHMVEGAKTRADSLFTAGNISQRVENIHSGMTNVLWCDGHVSSMPRTNITSAVLLP